MKKLSLKNLKLGADDLLQRNQLKSVLGGYGLGEGAENCHTNQGFSYDTIIQCICHYEDIDQLPGSVINNRNMTCGECTALCAG